MVRPRTMNRRLMQRDWQPDRPAMVAALTPHRLCNRSPDGLNQQAIRMVVVRAEGMIRLTR
jgi:hypothetical protein